MSCTWNYRIDTSDALKSISFLDANRVIGAEKICDETCGTTLVKTGFVLIPYFACAQ